MTTVSQPSYDTTEAYLTTRELALMLQVSPRWVIDKSREGTLPTHRLPGSNKLRFLASEIRAAMTSQAA